MQTIARTVVKKCLSKNQLLCLAMLIVSVTGITKNVISQVLITSQLPEVGTVVKTQLWNLTLSNAGTVNEQVRISMVLTDRKNGVSVLSAETGIITLLPGIKLLQYKDVQPVIYTVLNYNYGTDASPTGFLPAGNFDVCYTLTKKNAGTALAEDCSLILVEPLNPPLLIMPPDNAVVNELRPFFTWLPPAPLQLFNRLTYDFKLAEVQPKQQPEAALQQQLPLIYRTNLTANSFAYPASVSELDTGKLYAWQVTAMNNGMPVAASDVWTFKPKQTTGAEGATADNETAYFKLTTEQSSGYFICRGLLKLAYENNLNDTKASLHIYDITSKFRKETGNSYATITLKPGQNFIDYDAESEAGLINKHIYQLELVNSKGEVWSARFEYQKVKK